MNDYIDKIIIPYVNKVKDDYDLPLGQRAMVIFVSVDRLLMNYGKTLLKVTYLHHRATELHRSFFYNLWIWA